MIDNESLFFLVFLLLFGAIQLLNYRWDKRIRYAQFKKGAHVPTVESSDIIYKPSKGDFEEAEIHRMLLKRHYYYSALLPDLQNRFRHRLKRFMRTKVFIIKDDEAFKEMPVLISATAIQLTFGLKNYLLPFYRYIRIYPEEYLADHGFRVLAGNVQNRTITVAWNHFIKGISDHADGVNLGLHEMSHALYFQNLVVEGPYANRFNKKYKKLLSECHDAHRDEVAGKKDFYSSYAETDLQEFWAESVELFFEKPGPFQAHYPDVYEAMKLVLNQDPGERSNPVIFPNASLHERISKFLSYYKAYAKIFYKA